MSFLKSFWADARGNVAMMFGLAMIPLIGVVGAAVDYSRVSHVRVKLADSLDAALLAVGSQPAMGDQQTFDAVKAWLDVHMGTGEIANWQLNSVTQNNGRLVANASSTVDMTIARVLGVDQVPVAVVAEAVRSLGKVELALVLDNTGSMRGTKLLTLKDAADELVTSLADATKDPNDLKVALVPFSMTVNVGSQYRNAPWIDGSAASPIANEIFTKNANRFTLLDQMKVAWGGCVESRPYPYDVVNDAPSAANPASLYVPFFAPDEPDAGGAFFNSYLPDYKGDSAFKDRQGNPAKYTGAPKTGATRVGYQYGPNAGCELAPLQRLSSDTRQVRTAIAGMRAIGDTNIPMGLAWGWNALAPTGVFADGVPYGSEEWTKVVVLMTDGQNQNTSNSNDNDSFYAGVGYIWQDRVGVGYGSSESRRTDALDGRLSELCANMKAEGVVVYTVRVEVKSGSSAVLENCASSPDKFFDVQNVSELVAVFQKIGGSIQKLRLAM